MAIDDEIIMGALYAVTDHYKPEIPKEWDKIVELVFQYLENNGYKVVKDD